MKITKLLTLSILTLSSIFILAWCSNKAINQWDKVVVSYDSFLQDGKIVEEWKEITFTVWLWQTFPIFDTEVIDMQKWETKTFTASAKEWYSIYHNTNKVQNIATTVFNKIWSEPKVWETIELWDLQWLVLEVWPITDKIDFNNIETREPVEFKVKITDIVKTK
jgi:FKBP-type peptidyl-prolyl cis-trans isomerase 2